MKKLPRRTELSRQQRLPFPSLNGAVDLWNSLDYSQQQQCRRVLREILVAVIRQSPNAVHDHQRLPSHDSEELIDD
jgi:hypothetical protein